MGDYRKAAFGALLLGAGALVLSGDGDGPAIAYASPLAATSATTEPPAPLPAPPSPLDRAARAPATDVRIAPAKDGNVGAWLVLGPLRAASYGNDKKPIGAPAIVPPPPGEDEATLAPKLGEAWGAHSALNRNDPPRWTIAASNEGGVDLAALFKSKDTDLFAYAAATLHLEQAGKYVLLLGADDGVRVFVDGKPVLTRDESRPPRDDDDMIPLDLAAGDHPLLVKLHQRDGAWAFHARIVDAATFSAPVGAYLALSGSSAADARDLAGKMSWVSLHRGLAIDGYRPKLTVRFPEGMVRGAPVRVRARLVRAERGPDRGALVATADAPIVEADAGEVPIDASGAGELTATLPALTGADLARVEDKDFVYQIDAGGRHLELPFYPRHGVREAVARATRALASVRGDEAWLRPWSKDSVEHLRDRLSSFVQHGDADTDAQLAEAKELDDLAAALENKRDPYVDRTGAMRRAYRSDIDGQLSELGFYAPPKIDPEKKYPLIVALHGMNGRAMAMLRWLFGYDDPGRDQEWEERHMPSQLPTLNAFVVSPEAHGNAMYRMLGETDVMRVIEWAKASYPIDTTRVGITGPSMGGIGTAAIAFHHPDVFSAAEPLCGYHSYFIRRDYGGRPVRPWERLLADERSNISWAFNGLRIPLWIVHGKKDLPEANSGVLIDRYKELGYGLKHDHPDLGHNVWQDTYENLKGASWLLWSKRNEHPKWVRFRTVRLRFDENAWVHVDELAAPDVWGEVDAHARSGNVVEASVRGVRTLRFDRDEVLFDKTAPLTVRVGGAELVFKPDEPLVIHLDGTTWKPGAPAHEGPYKHGAMTGPIRDVFYEPITFVYGASDPAQARANEETARAWAKIRWGVRVDYPIVSDTEFLARGESVADDRALFLVGNARSNKVLRELDKDLPIRVDGDAIAVGGKRIEGRELGAAFIRPNPRRPDRYLVVVEGTNALGTLRSLSLPELLPDFVVYDASVAPARGQQLLSGGFARAAGFFTDDWALPAIIDDPSVAGSSATPAPRTEKEATSYLP